MGGLMMREAGVGYCRKRCSNQQEAGDVAKAVDHCSMCDVIAGLGAAPAGRVKQLQRIITTDLDICFAYDGR